MRDRLRATGNAEEDVDILAEFFSEDLHEWPADAWLAIDDYQFTMDSVVSSVSSTYWRNRHRFKC